MVAPSAVRWRHREAQREWKVGGKKKKRPAWPAGTVQSATCGALCAAHHEKDHKSEVILFTSSATESTLWCRCPQCGVAARPLTETSSYLR